MLLPMRARTLALPPPAVTSPHQVLLPVKWFSVPQCWRFETVQRGRKREHYQWNMDIIGEKSVAAEIELLAAVVDFFRAIGALTPTPTPTPTLSPTLTRTPTLTLTPTLTFSPTLTRH